jgi:UDP-N-acetylglucosamine acyltransferase
MSQSRSGLIHPTAIISPEAELAEDVIIGPYVVIEGKVKIGPECEIQAQAHLLGKLTMGRGNVVYTGAVLGQKPQHLRYNNEPTAVEIGDGNTFREHVTVHRGTTHSWVTRIGNDNFFMAGSHIAHDCIVGNRCIFANGALIGGHAVIDDNVYLSGNSAVHQFMRVGRLAMLGGCSVTTKDVPPFMVQIGIDNIVKFNVVGMKRAGLTPEQINGVRKAFRILFRSGLTLPLAIARMEEEIGHLDVGQEIITFLRGSRKGINLMRGRLRDQAA